MINNSINHIQFLTITISHSCFNTLIVSIPISPYHNILPSFNTSTVSISISPIIILRSLMITHTHHRHDYMITILYYVLFIAFHINRGGGVCIKLLIDAHWLFTQVLIDGVVLYIEVLIDVLFLFIDLCQQGERRDKWLRSCCWCQGSYLFVITI